MKKLGLIVLAVILALGALGAAYAAWNSTINVSAAVEMGTVIVGVAPADSTGTSTGSYISGGYYSGIS